MSMPSALRNLSIRNKIIAVFASLGVVIIVLGATSIDRFVSMNASVEEVTGICALAIGYPAGMQSAIQHYRLDLTNGTDQEHN